MSLAFLQQENLIIFPEKLRPDHKFSFVQEFEEVFVTATDGAKLHGLLFKVDAPKGLVFYLHGNAGSVDSWGWAAQTYTDLGYDCFVFDYRGYGKSEGSISSETQFYEDAQAAYEHLRKSYHEQEVIIAGYSIGTAAAAKLASENEPRLLVLQAPYYSLSDLSKSLYPIIPSFLLKYKFETYRFLENIKAPVVLFHGAQDEIIYHGSSEKLKAHLKPTDQVIILQGQGHNGMNENPKYKEALAVVLAAVK
ncbi:alpha/beta hydrolase [Pontibacter sp. H249]|uniref:alpha/beta hydrolase n=1 Tax=Pontibacter sp. H249 TaxID=3133420 RepID=UPI0030C34733